MLVFKLVHVETESRPSSIVNDTNSSDMDNKRSTLQVSQTTLYTHVCVHVSVCPFKEEELGTASCALADVLSASNQHDHVKLVLSLRYVHVQFGKSGNEWVFE